MFDSSFQTVALIIYSVNIVRSTSILNKASPQDILDDADLIQILNSKSYIPNEAELPNAGSLNNNENDETFILSKLSDDDLINALSDNAKLTPYETKEMNKVLNINKISSSNNNNGDIKDNINEKPDAYEPQVPVFKLNHKEVNPYVETKDLKYNAIQKIKNMLYKHPQENNLKDDAEKKELFFDVLVAQLKSLCCKTGKQKYDYEFQQFLNKRTQKEETKSKKRPNVDDKNINIGKQPSKEFIFLVINDEIQSNASEDLILVDPDSLAKNSSALLLGPITTPLSEAELKLVISRIANELARPEYLPLLYKLSDGSLAENSDLFNSLITGPETRRYIKPHRCNHQSKLAKVYGGPKWLICTGYLNLNRPSLYD